MLNSDLIAVNGDVASVECSNRTNVESGCVLGAIAHGSLSVCCC